MTRWQQNMYSVARWEQNLCIIWPAKNRICVIFDQLKTESVYHMTRWEQNLCMAWLAKNRICVLCDQLKIESVYHNEEVKTKSVYICILWPGESRLCTQWPGESRSFYLKQDICKLKGLCTLLQTETEKPVRTILFFSC